MDCNELMKKIKDFLKKETVLCIALMLAAVSAFVVPPDKEYLSYIDFRTLAILFCLMSVMAGLQQMGVFGWIAQKLLAKVKNVRQLMLILVLLCFFFSMLITNDVSLITFVPFTFIVLRLLSEEQQRKLLLPVVVMQTIAANLGSMLTPIGNPQNLYLYGKAGISMGGFLWLMLPYTLCSLVLLCGWCLLEERKVSDRKHTDNHDEKGLPLLFAEQVNLTGKGKSITVYLILFALCLLTVARLLPYEITFLLVLAAIFSVDKQVLTKVDYSLLLTFAGFFIFIGNMGRIPVFCEFLQKMITGNEVYTAVIASQIISNVPAALLLSGFTQDIPALIVGTNLGGLGTLIASMASLISYKYIAKEAGNSKGAYIKRFTIANVFFLIVLLTVQLILT